MAREVERWVTISGRRIPIFKSEGVKTKLYNFRNKIIRAKHITTKQNMELILDKGFNLDKAGKRSRRNVWKRSIFYYRRK